MERYCNYVLSIWNDVLKFVTGKIVNKMANDGMEEVRVSALAYMLRYDKRTLDKRGRRIRNIDFLTALRKSNAKYARMEVTHFSNTVNDGILYARNVGNNHHSVARQWIMRHWNQRAQRSRSSMVFPRFMLMDTNLLCVC